MSGLAKTLRAEAGIIDHVEPLRLPLSPPETAPIVGPVSYGPFSNPLMAKTLEKFGKRAFERSSACMEFDSFLHRIDVRGGTCVEIGTYQGITAVLLTQFFERVVCVSVDVDFRRIIKTDIVDHLGLADRIEFHDIEDLSLIHI